MSILEDTEAYESWLGTQCKVVEKDLARNHASWPLSTDFCNKICHVMPYEIIHQRSRSKQARAAGGSVSKRYSLCGEPR